MKIKKLIILTTALLATTLLLSVTSFANTYSVNEYIQPIAASTSKASPETGTDNITPFIALSILGIGTFILSRKSKKDRNK